MSAEVVRSGWQSFTSRLERLDGKKLLYGRIALDTILLVIWFPWAFTKSLNVYRHLCSPLLDPRDCNQWAQSSASGTIWLWFIWAVFVAAFMYVSREANDLRRPKASRNIKITISAHLYMTVLWLVLSTSLGMEPFIVFVALSICADVYLFIRFKKIASQQRLMEEFQNPPQQQPPVSV